MANVNMTQGLKLIGDRASGAAGASAALNGMSVDDNTHTFLNTDTACATQGASPHFQSNGFDATPIGGGAATPYVVTHLMTLASGQFNTFTVKRLGLHNTAAATDAGTSLMFGSDGFSFVKQSTFTMTFTMKLSYT